MFQNFRNVQKTMFDSKNGLLFGGATGEDKMAGLAQLGLVWKNCDAAAAGIFAIPKSMCNYYKIICFPMNLD